MDTVIVAMDSVTAAVLSMILLRMLLGNMVLDMENPPFFSHDYHIIEAIICQMNTIGKNYW